MSLSFNGSPSGSSSIRNRTDARISYIALCVASSFLSAFLIAGDSYAEDVDLAPNILGNYSEELDNIKWLLAPGHANEHHKYFLAPLPCRPGQTECASVDWSYPALGIKDTNVALEIDARQRIDNLSIDKIDVRDGALDIIPGHNANVTIEAFHQTGGRVALSSKKETAGVKMPAIEIGGGEMHIDVTKGIGIHNENFFRQTGGSTSITAAGTGIGLHTHNFRLDDGFMLLRHTDSGKAISIFSVPDSPGQFRINGGKLQLMGTGEKAVVYGDDNSQAFFGKNSLTQPVIDLTSSGKLATGLMSFGHITIEQGATVEFRLSQAAMIDSSSSVEIPFLESRNSEIKGEFTNNGAAASSQGSFYTSRLLYDYDLVKTAEGKGNHY